MLHEYKTILLINSAKKNFSVSNFLQPCQESILNIEYKGLDKDDVHKLTLEHIPQLSLTFNGPHAFVEIENEDIRSCTDIIIIIKFLIEVQLIQDYRVRN